MHTAKSLKNIKIMHIVLPYKKSLKMYILACILSFNNQFIKAMRTRLIF